MKKYNRGNLNEVANTYKKMILEDYSEETSTTQRRPRWDPITGPGARPFVPPKPTPKPPPPPPTDPRFYPEPKRPIDFFRPLEYVAPGAGWRPPVKIPPAVGRAAGVLGLPGAIAGAAMLGWDVGTWINDTFIDPMYRPAKPTQDQWRPLPTEILPSPESLYPRPSPAGPGPGGIAGGGRSSGGSSSGGGMGGM